MASEEIDAAADLHNLVSTTLHEAGVEVRLAGTITRLLREAESAEEEAGAPTLLSLLACEAAGGRALQALPVAAAWRILHIASKLIDDVEDGDADRLRSGPGKSALLVNLATGLYAASSLCLLRLPAALYLDLTPMFHRTILRMVGGQQRELDGAEGESVDGCLAVIGEKAASFFALSTEAGARCATKDEAVIGRLREFGFNAGMIVQLADDLDGFRESGPYGDLANGRRKLPMIYSLSVATPSEQRELERLLERAVEDPRAEAEVRHLMLGIGAETYMALQIALYRRRALNALTHNDGRFTPLHQWLHAITTYPNGVPPDRTASHQRTVGPG